MDGKRILVLILTLISVILIFTLVNFFSNPIGVPLDYYDLSDNLNNSNMAIYYKGNNTPFNRRVSYNEINSILDVSLETTSPLNALIIEFDDSTQLTDSDVEHIETLYHDNCFYIVLINYHGSKLNHLIDSNDTNKPFIFLDYTMCGDFYFSSSIDFPEENTYENIQYTITQQLERKID